MYGGGEKTRQDKKNNLLHPVLGFPVNPWIHWQLQTWLYGVPNALGPQGSRMHGSEQVKLLASQYFVVWQSGSTRHSGTRKIKIYIFTSNKLTLHFGDMYQQAT